MRPPTITAVVRVHNGEEHVATTIEAILGQTRPPEEVVVVDDGSTDGTGGELARFGGEIRLVRQANGGHASAFNRCFEEARGDFVANCDADDVWQPDKLARQGQALTEHPGVDVAFAAAELFGSDSGPFNAFGQAGVLDARTFGPILYRANPICTSSAVVRRRLFATAGPFPDGVAEDYDFWLRVVGGGGTFYFDPTPLVHYRVHAKQASVDLARMHEAEYRAHDRHPELAADGRMRRDVLAGDLCRVGYAKLAAGDAAGARSAYSAALRHRRSPRTLAWLAALGVPTGPREALIATARALR